MAPSPLHFIHSIDDYGHCILKYREIEPYARYLTSFIHSLWIPRRTVTRLSSYLFNFSASNTLLFHVSAQFLEGPTYPGPSSVSSITLKSIFKNLGRKKRKFPDTLFVFQGGWCSLTCVIVCIMKQVLTCCQYKIWLELTSTGFSWNTESQCTNSAWNSGWHSKCSIVALLYLCQFSLTLKCIVLWHMQSLQSLSGANKALWRSKRTKQSLVPKTSTHYRMMPISRPNHKAI